MDRVSYYTKREKLKITTNGKNVTILISGDELKSDILCSKTSVPRNITQSYNFVELSKA